MKSIFCSWPLHFFHQLAYFHLRENQEQEWEVTVSMFNWTAWVIVLVIHLNCELLTGFSTILHQGKPLPEHYKQAPAQWERKKKKSTGAASWRGDFSCQRCIRVNMNKILSFSLWQLTAAPWVNQQKPIFQFLVIFVDMQKKQLTVWWNLKRRQFTLVIV